MLEIARGLEYLHDHRVVHGDLRGDNVLIDDELHVRLTDFGLTTLMGSHTRTNGSRLGLIPMAWAAVELLGDLTRPDFACDIYSFACTCVEVCLPCRSYNHTALSKYIRCIVAGSRLAI